MEFRRLFDIPVYQSIHLSQKVSISEGYGIAQKTYSSQDIVEEIMSVSAGALTIGLGRGDKVGIISNHSSIQWTFLDLGLQQVGIIPVPISPLWDQETLQYIIKDSGIKIAFVQDREQYEQVKEINDQFKYLSNIYTFEKLPDILGWEDFVAVPTPPHLEQYEASRAVTHEDDIATIIYTDGTTTKPKGVILSHKNMIHNIKGLLQIIPIKSSHHVVSILPQHHFFERLMIYAYLAVGAKLYFIKPTDSLLDDIKNIRPHYFNCTPELLKTFYSQIVENSLKQAKKNLTWFLWAIQQGRKYKDYDRLSILYFIKLKIADFLVFKHWRQLFGGRIEAIFVGNNPIAPSFARLFSAAGIDIREGYGLAETAGIIAFNPLEPTLVNFGTVGQTLEGIEVKIKSPKDEYGNGEILVQGNNIMKGYWNNEEMTSKVIQDNWFYTGDIGRWTHQNKFLQIAGRKKDIITLANHQTINPLFIETQLYNSPFIYQCMVIGEGQEYLSILIIPSYINLKIWSTRKKLSFNTQQELISHPKVIHLFKKEINHINQQFNSNEKIKKFQLLKKEWTYTTGELTPNMKLNRSFVLEKYALEIESMYSK